jgi:hypothetical protein
MAFEWNEASGEVAEGGIRYLLMRPDVLMGVTQDLSADGAKAFLSALERSVFRHAQASFLRYVDTERFAAEDLLAGTFRVAATLGWGVWTLDGQEGGLRVVHVNNSPFALGHGPSIDPVCAAITGVLRAVTLVAYGVESEVVEVACRAQGAPHCLFHMRKQG